MHTKTSDVRKRLNRFSKPSALLEKDKRKFHAILKQVEIATREKENYLKALRHWHLPDVGIRYFLAATGWLKDRRFLEREKHGRRFHLSLSSKGKEALQILDDYLSCALDGHELKVNLGFSGSNIALAKLERNIDNLTESTILSNEFVRDRVLELMAVLSLFDKDIRLIIEVPGSENRSIVNLLTLLWSFYREKVTKKQNSIFTPLYIDMRFVDEESRAMYTAFWKRHFKKVMKYDGLKAYVLENAEHAPYEKEENSEGEGVNCFPLLPSKSLEDMLPSMLQEAETKLWVEERLSRDPDWFMPHFFWVKLGFKQRRQDITPASVSHVSPPIFHEVTSPSLSRRYAEWDSVFKYTVKENGEKRIGIFMNLLIMGVLDWKKRDFYENWKTVKRVHRSTIEGSHKLKEIATILNAALLEYIISDYTPSVNLKLVFKDYLIQKDSDKIALGIGNGHYRLEPSE